MERMRDLYQRGGQAYRRVMTGNAPVLDATIGAVVAAGGILEADRIGGALAALLLGGVLAVRRRWPLAVYLATFGLVIGLAHSSPLSAFVGVLIGGYTLAAYGRWPWLSFLVLFASAIFVTLVLDSNLNFLPEQSSGFLIIGTLWLSGSAIRVRQRRADELIDRAQAREREQEIEQKVALAEQRAQIARELHDVVTHSVSVMVIQAGAARHVMERDPEAAADALIAVEARGREALAELRGFLGVLDERVDDDPALAPQPGIGDIEALVSGVAGAGLPVTLEVIGARRELPHGIDLAAYRVVQEALTNAIKYADGSATEVVLEYRQGEVALEVLDEGPGRAPTPDGAGRGLHGLRERLAVYGGRLEAGRRPSGGYAVRAWIPTGEAAL